MKVKKKTSCWILLIQLSYIPLNTSAIIFIASRLTGRRCRKALSGNQTSLVTAYLSHIDVKPTTWIMRYDYFYINVLTKKIPNIAITYICFNFVYIIKRLSHFRRGPMKTQNQTWTIRNTVIYRNKRFSSQLSFIQNNTHFKAFLKLNWVPYKEYELKSIYSCEQIVIDSRFERFGSDEYQSTLLNIADRATGIASILNCVFHSRPTTSCWVRGGTVDNIRYAPASTTRPVALNLAHNW